MRIVCPSCQAAYEVPETLLSGGSRRVRCAKCGDNWVPEIESGMPGAAPDADLPPDPAEPPTMEGRPDDEAAPGPPPLRAEPVARLPEAPPAPPPGRTLVLVAAFAWAASVAVLAGGAWAAVAFRADVMAAWGPSRRIYALLGLG